MGIAIISLHLHYAATPLFSATGTRACVENVSGQMRTSQHVLSNNTLQKNNVYSYKALICTTVEPILPYPARDLEHIHRTVRRGPCTENPSSPRTKGPCAPVESTPAPPRNAAKQPIAFEEIRGTCLSATQLPYSPPGVSSFRVRGTINLELRIVVRGWTLHESMREARVAAVTV